MSGERTDFIVLRRWEDLEGHEKDKWGDWVWPPPPEFVESRIEGRLREDILNRLARPIDDACEVRIIESEIEGGYSEYTVEVEYGIEVWIHEGRQSQKVWENDYAYSSENSLASLLKWIEPSP